MQYLDLQVALVCPSFFWGDLVLTTRKAMACDARDGAKRSSNCDTFCLVEKCELSTNVKMLNRRKQRGHKAARCYE